MDSITLISSDPMFSPDDSDGENPPRYLSESDDSSSETLTNDTDEENSYNNESTAKGLTAEEKYGEIFFRAFPELDPKKI